MTPTLQDTLRALDAELGERLGILTWAKSWDGGCRALAPTDEVEEEEWADLALKTCSDWTRFVPAYSSSLDACARAEARIVEMGLGWAYENEMRGLLPDDKTFGVWCLTAPAEVRCRAMLAVLAQDDATGGE